MVKKIVAQHAKATVLNDTEKRRRTNNAFGATGVPRVLSIEDLITSNTVDSIGLDSGCLKATRSVSLAICRVTAHLNSNKLRITGLVKRLGHLLITPLTNMCSLMALTFTRKDVKSL